MQGFHGSDGRRVRAMKRKTLIFIEDGSFTFDNRVIRETETLVQAGWDVTVISPKYPQDPFYRRISDRLRAYYYLKPTAKSVPGHVIEHSISLCWGSVLTLWVWVRHGFSIFHACNPMDILWLIALPYKLLGKKFVYDQHDLCPELWMSRNARAPTGFLYRVLRALESASYRYADIVISTNETYRDVAVTRGGRDPQDVFVVRNGPDLGKFRPIHGQKTPGRNGHVLVGYLGNMNPQDGVGYLLDAAFEVAHTRGRSDVSFVVIGGGSDYQHLRDKSAQMGLGDRITFTGRIPDEEMLTRLSACDVCVQPDPLNDLNDKSTMNKAMEYMALEKAVVAFDLKETRISCGDAALYATPNDVKDLADKILCLVDNPALRRQLGERGRSRVEQAFSWSHSIPNLLAAYDRAMEGTQPRYTEDGREAAAGGSQRIQCEENIGMRPAIERRGPGSSRAIHPLRRQREALSAADGDASWNRACRPPQTPAPLAAIRANPPS